MSGHAYAEYDIAVSFDLVRGSGSGHICDMEVNYGR